MDQFLSLQNQQQHEQILATVRTAVMTLYAYYTGLLEAGFTQDQAWALTIAFQREGLRNGRQQQEGA